ncbi:MAG: SufE family protein [Pseudomonadota bacterium]
MQNNISVEELEENLSFLEDWEERYKYILDLGQNLTPFPEEKQNDTYRVKGCVSQVWLDYEKNNDRLIFSGSSDSHLVRGLIALLFIAYSGKTAPEIQNVDFKSFFTKLGLSEHLTPQRSNGLFSMVGRIQDIAAAVESE